MEKPLESSELELAFIRLQYSLHDALAEMELMRAYNVPITNVVETQLRKSLMIIGQNMKSREAGADYRIDEVSKRAPAKRIRRVS